MSIQIQTRRSTGSPVAAPGKSATRRSAELRGRVAEFAAAALLVLKGYRILAVRTRGPFGEIDLIATRGRRIAFVEVKQRRDARHATAVACEHTSATRLANAAERWLGRHPRYRDYRVGLDAVVLGRSLVPRHIPDALNAW